MEKAAEAGVVVVGGHTVDDEEIKYGMAVTGSSIRGASCATSARAPGDALLLTKPLGTGIVTTALKRGALGAETYDALVASMTTLNRAAARAMLRCEVHAATDVTGFGLLGHGHEMARGSGVTLEIDSSSLPLLPELEEHIVAGHLTGGCKRIRAYLDGKVAVAASVSATLSEAAYDPQTSGGLLIALPAKDVDRLLDDLAAAGLTSARVIGRVQRQRSHWVELG